MYRLYVRNKKQVVNEIIENVKSPKGKRCKIISPPDVSSTGCHTNVVVKSLLPYSLPINNFSISKVDLGTATPFPFLWDEKGKKEAKYQCTN